MSDQIVNVAPTQTDHDAIVTLVSEVGHVRNDLKDVKADIKELKDNFASRVDVLELGKLDKEEAVRLQASADKVHEKFDARITRLERAYLIGMGIIAALEFYLRFFRN